MGYPSGSKKKSQLQGEENTGQEGETAVKQKREKKPSIIGQKRISTQKTQNN